MTLTQAEIDDTAAALIKAEATCTQIGLVSLRYPQMGMDDAYRVQNAILAHKRAAGHRVIGWKIGLTSKAMQDALKIDVPDSGILFDHMAVPDAGRIAAGRFIQPRIEAEIAFVMKSPLIGENVTREDVIAATDYVAPSLEILDTRILRADPETGQVRGIVDTISDNAANAGVILGAQRHAVETHDLRWVGAIVRRNGEVEETGLGAGVLDDPVESVVWLARRMAQYGQGINAGDIILSGSFIRPIEAPPGCEISADFGPFGAVSCTFE